MLIPALAFVTVMILGTAYDCRAEIVDGWKYLRDLFTGRAPAEAVSEAQIRRVLRSRSCKR
jgi:hypothetical protein